MEKTMSEKLELVREHAVDYIDDLLARSPYEDIDLEASELHHHIFNEDYFMVGTWNAKQWLGNQAFEAIEKIKEYEQDNFGQVTTDFSDAEKVANMLAYVLGEEILNESKTLQDSWDETLDRNALDSIRCELKRNAS
tara:strand:+ start:9480 stop:9890 length:411 start_codon:yes stop_codon:yes gene_type:complete